MQLDEACRLYNAALEERKCAWRMQGITLGYLDQANQLKAIRAAGDVGVSNFAVCQNVLRRVDRAFSAFFRRVKAGNKTPGYPRFRSRLRYDSLTWAGLGNGCALRASGRLYLQGIGEVKVKWHCSLPSESVVKSIVVRRQAGCWYVCFNLELQDFDPLPQCNVAVGIDVGLTTFAVLSDGVEIENPRFYRAAERRLRIANRRLSRRRKGSRRRLKARQQVARVQLHITNQRRDFQHKTAFALVLAYGLIAVENLNVKGLAASMLAKSVHDASWGQFVSILSGKAEEAGRTMVLVNPAGTTQHCSSCGEYVPKSLGERWHSCHACGLSLNRDHNAALNILRSALNQRPGWGPRALTVEVTHAIA